VPAAASHYRALLLSAAAALYPLIFATFLLVERPGLGVGHFYYIPIALVALANGPAWGAGAGIASTGFYTLGIVISPRLPTYDVLTASSSIRLFTYTMVGVLVGWFAHSHRVLVDRLRVAAERDFLTGLLNTRAFDAALSTRLEQGKPFGLVLGDMDNLKDVNDTFGHEAGDLALRLLGDALQTGLRRSDEAYRLGGDEFGVVLAGASRLDAERVSRRLAAAVSVCAKPPLTSIEASFGIAVHEPGEIPEGLMGRADDALYRAKRRRRTSAA
jgi:diguanylate cyclase (GGDEF)-like protein